MSGADTNILNNVAGAVHVNLCIRTLIACPAHAEKRLSGRLYLGRPEIQEAILHCNQR
jgi:hypothetical protein